jgi:hypothetical protein
MRLNVPPLIPYVVGAMLVIFGALRMKYLGAPKESRPRDDEESASTEQPPLTRGKEQRRHLRMGVVWILLGLFLLVSTYIQIRRSQDSAPRRSLIQASWAK